MASIIIVDDHPAIRMAVKFMVMEKGHTILGDYDNGVDALQQIRNLKPDVVILDINIPQIDGFDVLKRINELDYKPKIIVLSSHDSEHVKVRCIQLGVHAFLSKVEELTKLNDLIDKVLCNKPVFEYGLRVDARNSGNIDDGSALDTLSNREMSVMLALCRGDSNKQIAADLILSEKTISTYKNRLMLKLNVSNIAELIDFAKRHSLV